jgi:hypothetical protein
MIPSNCRVDRNNVPRLIIHHLLLTLLPVIAKPLLQSIVLLYTCLILAMLTRHIAFLPLIPLNPQIRAKLDRSLPTLGKLIQPLVCCDRRAVFLLILPRTKRSVPRNGVGRLTEFD